MSRPLDVRPAGAAPAERRASGGAPFSYGQRRHFPGGMTVQALLLAGCRLLKRSRPRGQRLPMP